MRRSKFEIYIAVLETLLANGPMRLTKITCKTNLNYSLLKQAVNDLRKRQLIEETKINNSFTYAATPKAELVISQVKEVSQSFPFFKEYLVNLTKS